MYQKDPQSKDPLSEHITFKLEIHRSYRVPTITKAPQYD